MVTADKAECRITEDRIFKALPYVDFEMLKKHMTFLSYVIYTFLLKKHLDLKKKVYNRLSNFVNLDTQNLGHFMITHFNNIFRCLVTDPTNGDETIWLANRLSLLFCYYADYFHCIHTLPFIRAM